MHGQLQLTQTGQPASIQLTGQHVHGGQIQLTTGQHAGQIQMIQQPIQQQQQQQHISQQTAVKVGTGLDLGELMKDVGLDLDGFGMDDQTQQQQTEVPEVQLRAEPVPAAGSQMIAQIQQPLPLQVLSRTYL
jgi:hypothetical protein